MTVQHKNPVPDANARAKVAFRALGELIMEGGLPPDAIEHLKAAHESILAHATTLATTPAEGAEGGIPLGDTIATTKRREAGEDPDPGDHDDEGDEAPRAKGTKTNPLGIKGWASSTSANDDDEPEEKPKKKPAATVAKVGSKARFLPRGRR